GRHTRTRPEGAKRGSRRARSFFALLRRPTFVRRLRRCVLDRAERGREPLDTHQDVLPHRFRLRERDVLHVDDAIELADSVEELGDLVEAPGELDPHRDARVELLRDFGARRPRRERDARYVRDVLHGAQERRILRVRGEYLVELALSLLARRELGEVLFNRKSTRLNSSHVKSSYAVFCLKKKK